MSPLNQEKKMMLRFMLSFGLVAGSAWAGNPMTDLKLAATPSGVDVTVTCGSAPVFNVFRLKDPDRLVVDVSNAEVAKIAGHHDGQGPVTGIVASQFSDDKAQVGRLLVGLANARRYDVKAIENGLVISIEAAGAEPVVASTVTEKAAAQPAVVAEPERATVPGETVVSSRIDEQKVKNPATRLKAITATNGKLNVVTDGELPRFEIIELADPPRLALDLFGLKGNAHPKVSLANVKDVRVGAHADKVRVVVEFSTPMGFDVRRNAQGLSVKLSQARPQAETAEAHIDGEDVRLETEGQAATVEQPAAAATVTNVQFKESSTGGNVRISLKGSTRWNVERPDAKSAVLTLEGAHIAHQLERSLDTAALGTPVKMVSVFGVPGGAERVRLVVAGDRQLDQVMVERPGQLEWKFSATGSTEQLVAENASAGFAAEADQVVEESGPQQRRNYVGKRVSFEFKDIELHNLLRIIAEISKKNIVVADDVQGKVTVRLRNVPWDQALDLVLRSKSLGKEEFGNIIRVARLDQLANEEKLRAERALARQLSIPLAVTLVPVNYATANDMASRVKEVLSARGNVAIDARTNTLIVRDLPENIAKARSLVASLDLQTPQVLIESRIIEATTSFRREVGIQWGGRGIMSSAFGNPTGLAFPSSLGVVGGASTVGSAGNPNNANYAVSLPVGASDGAGGALGMTFGSVTQAVELNLRLSALEAQGSIKTISAPKVTTLDNSTATISQGVSLPFSQVSAAGASTAFIEAALALEVTPHITADGSVLMNINARNNQPDPANTGSNGQPGIARKEARTNVLVKDGETTVIGGIYVRATSTTQAGLPILSKIPVLGFFFRNSRENEVKNELLVFVTPRILNRAAVAQNP